MKAAKKNSRRDEIFTEIAHNSSRLMALGKDDPDSLKVMWLGVGIGQVAERMASAHVAGTKPRLESQLIRLAAHCVGWVESKPEAPKDVFASITLERTRQNQLLRDGKIKFNCDSPDVDDLQKFPVLLEEGGEVADAIQTIETLAAEGKPAQAAREHLITELIQVAAVSVAWLESLEAK